MKSSSEGSAVSVSATGPAGAGRPRSRRRPRSATAERQPRCRRGRRSGKAHAPTRFARPPAHGGGAGRQHHPLTADRVRRRVHPVGHRHGRGVTPAASPAWRPTGHGARGHHQDVVGPVGPPEVLHRRDRCPDVTGDPRQDGVGVGPPRLTSVTVIVTDDERLLPADAGPCERCGGADVPTRSPRLPAEPRRQPRATAT